MTARALMPYPAFMVLTGRAAVVIGGGDTAERIVRELLEAGASVRMISPLATPALGDLAASGAVRWERRVYAEDDLRGAFLAVAATGDRTVNRVVGDAAKRLGIPVSVPDDPAQSTLLVPEHFRRGPIQVAVSAGGAGTALADRLRRMLEREVPALYGPMAEIIERYREKALEEIPTKAERNAFLRDLVAFLDGPEVHEDLAAGHLDGALAGARDLLRRHAARP
jgi:siroheme synthase-like protein